jgi:hypothetical protein
MDTVVDIAQVIAMVAALAAVWYAQQAVVETRALRREDRLARLLDLVAEVGETGTRTARGQAADTLLDIARHRLRAAIEATNESLPNCRELVDVDWPHFVSSEQAIQREREAVATLGAALDEVATLLVRLRS